MRISKWTSTKKGTDSKFIQFMFAKYITIIYKIKHFIKGSTNTSNLYIPVTIVIFKTCPSNWCQNNQIHQLLTFSELSVNTSVYKTWYEQPWSRG